jgi:hypothetical protein
MCHRKTTWKTGNSHRERLRSGSDTYEARPDVQAARRLAGVTEQAWLTLGLARLLTVPRWLEEANGA